ncbi:MAG: CsgG/HfaB family protein [Candidatus Neomarinimicrobiota bacterium]
MFKSLMKSTAIFLSWTTFVFSITAPLAGQQSVGPAQVNDAMISQTAEGSGKLVVAIIDLEGRGISALEAQTLTDRMRSELVSTGAVTIVERGQMAEILDEQGFQQTGCVSSECAVEVGKLLGVSQMATGSIGKIGSSYTIDVRMFAVEDGAIVRSVNRTYSGPIDGLITEIEMISWRLIDIAPPPGRFPGMAQEAASQPVAQAPAAAGAPKARGKGLMWLLLLAAVGGGGYYAYDSGLLEGGSDELPEPPSLPGN